MIHAQHVRKNSGQSALVCRDFAFSDKVTARNAAETVRNTMAWMSADVTVEFYGYRSPEDGNYHVTVIGSKHIMDGAKWFIRLCLSFGRELNLNADEPVLRRMTDLHRSRAGVGLIFHQPTPGHRAGVFHAPRPDSCSSMV